MFARVKKSRKYQHVQVVLNARIDGRVRQRVIAKLSRLKVLMKSGQLDFLAFLLCQPAGTRWLPVR